MAKKPKKKDKIVDEIGVYELNVKDVVIDEYIYQEMLKYGANVSIFRACPAVKDGLIPVVRRTLYSFYKAGATYDKPRKKAAKLLGDVSGLHPHGNLSIENAFRNEIKEYETNALLYDTHGSKGSQSGQKSAAIRYLDTKLSMFATYCFFHKDDYNTDLLDMVETYTRDDVEPVALMSRYPYMLLTNTTGVGWGNAFSSVPFNLVEVFQLTQQLIHHPEMTNVWLFPDSPRGYDIIDDGSIQELCDSGKGTLKIQAKIEIGYDEGEKETYLSVTGFPEQTFMDNVTTSISKMIISKQITGIKTWKDKSYTNDDGSEHMEFHLILEPDADPELVKDTLYRKTQLRHYLSINFNFAARTSMQHLGLKDCLLLWISNRVSYKTKVIAKKVYKLKEKIHVLEGINTMLNADNVERTVSIIKRAEDRDDANQKLVEEYGVTTYQANCVTNIRLTEITKKGRESVPDTLRKIKMELKEQTSLLGDSSKIKDLICEELQEGIELFGKPRACRIIDQSALEPPKYKFNVVITKKYIKKLSASDKLSVGAIAPDDEVVAAFTNIPEDNQLYVIDDFGVVYGIKLNKVSPSSLTSKGMELKELVGEHSIPIKAFKALKKDKDLDEYALVMFTENGLIKRSLLSNYVTNRTSLQGISLNSGDKVCYVMLMDPSDFEVSPYALIYTERGLGVALNINTVPFTDRVTKGSNFLALEENDRVRGVIPITDDYLFVLSNKGYGKICEMDDIFKTSKRRTAMIKLAGLAEDDTIFRIMPFNMEDRSGKYICMLQSGTKVEIQKSDIELTTRVSKGKKLVPVKRGDSIIKIKEV